MNKSIKISGKYYGKVIGDVFQKTIASDYPILHLRKEVVPHIRRFNCNKVVFYLREKNISYSIKVEMIDSCPLVSNYRGEKSYIIKSEECSKRSFTNSYVHKLTKKFDRKSLGPVWSPPC